MKRINGRRRLPTPSFVLALAAFVIAIGGTAFAVSKAPKNSVVSASIKKGAVKSQDLQDGGIGSQDVKDDSLTGSDIVESTLALPEAQPQSEGAAGPAGGDLTGSYPNPEIGPGVVGSQELGDGAVNSQKIANKSVAEADIGAAAVGSAELQPNAVNSATVSDDSLLGQDIANSTITGSDVELGHLFQSTTSVADSNDKTTEATCPAGRVVVGGGFDLFGPGQGSVNVSVSRALDSNTWVVSAEEVAPEAGNWGVIAQAVCMYL